MEGNEVNMVTSVVLVEDFWESFSLMKVLIRRLNTGTRKIRPSEADIEHKETIQCLAEVSFWISLPFHAQSYQLDRHQGKGSPIIWSCGEFLLHGGRKMLAHGFHIR